MHFLVDPFCPVCKIENLPGAAVCAFCNHPLQPADIQKDTSSLRIPENPQGCAASSARTRRSLLLAVPGHNRIIQVDGNQAFILGRNLEQSAGPQGEAILDLTPFEAHDNGVSRRHALVRPVEDGFEICDMGSTNGTWLNQTRILPGRAYRLDTESEIRLGRMVLRLFVRANKAHTAPIVG